MTCPWNFCRIQVWPEQDCGKAQNCLFWAFVPLSFPLCLFSFSCLLLSFIAFFGLAEHTSHLSHGDRSGKEQELCKPAVYRAFHPAVSAVQAPRLTLKHNDQRPTTAKRNKQLLFIWKKEGGWNILQVSYESLQAVVRELTTVQNRLDCGVTVNIFDLAPWVTPYLSLPDNWLLVMLIKSFWALTKLLWNS